MMEENQFTEFKSSFNEVVIETLCAFVNAKGGKVYIGLDDSANPVTNFSIGKETLQHWINEIKNKTQPGIVPNMEIVLIQGKEVVCITVPEFPVKPVSFKGRYFKRVNNSNHQLSPTEISDMSMQSLQLSWDSYFSPHCSIDDLDMLKIEKFIDKINQIGRFTLEASPVENLEKLRLIYKNQVSNAAVLLFSKGDTIYNVHLGRFKTPSHIIDDKMLRGTLFDVVEETMKYIVSHLKVAFEITGRTTQRTEIFEYPLAALRELVLNSIIHRDYLSPVDIQIKIFDTKITFFNPGNLFGNLTIDDLKKDNYQAYARNKLIAEAFYLTGDIEKYGSGFIRIRKEVKKYPTMQFSFEEIPNGFLATIHYEKQKVHLAEVNVVDDVVDNVVEKEKQLLELIQANKKISAQEMAVNLQLTPRTIQRYLKGLQDKDRLERIGSAKGGYWKIK